MENSMIDSVLKDICEAEELADRMIKDSYQKGKDIVLGAEAEADRQKKETVTSCKEDMKKALRDAQQLAGERRAAILKKGAEAAEELAEQKNSRIEEAAEQVLDAILKKY